MRIWIQKIMAAVLVMSLLLTGTVYATEPTETQPPTTEAATEMPTEAPTETPTEEPTEPETEATPPAEEVPPM